MSDDSNRHYEYRPIQRQYSRSPSPESVIWNRRNGRSSPSRNSIQEKRGIVGEEREERRDFPKESRNPRREDSVRSSDVREKKMPSKANKKRMAAEKSSAKANESSAPPPVPQELTPPKTSTNPPDVVIATPRTEPVKMDSLTVVKPVEVITNSYGMTVKPKTVYRYDVTIERRRNENTTRRDEQKKPGELPMPLAGSKGGDRQRQSHCAQLIKKALELSDLGHLRIVYDGANVLYTADQLKESISIEIPSSELSRELQQTHFQKNQNGSLLIKIEPNTKRPVLNTADLLDESLNEMSVQDRSVTMLMQVALSQEARDNGFLVVDGSSQLFNMSGNPLSKTKGVEERDGIAAGVKVAEGANKRGQAQIVLDYKRTQFFNAGPLLNLPINWRNPSDVRKYLKGLRVGTTYSQQVVTISDISKLPIGEMRTDDGRSLLELCAETAGRRVSDYNKDLRAVEVRIFHRADKVMRVFNFPMENLVVLADQRLGPKHGNPPRAVRPAERFTATKRTGEDSHILSNNETLKTFGVEIGREPIKVKAVTVESPSIVYGGNSKTTPNIANKASWEVPTRRGPTGGLVSPSKISNLLIMYNSRAERNPQDAERKVYELSEKLPSFGRNLGVTISSTNVTDLSAEYRNVSPIEAIVRKMEELGKLTEKPVVLYADDSSHPTHDILKLHERLNEIVTQHVSLDKSLRKQGRNTMHNILLKLNAKTGGFNHKVEASPNISRLWGQQSNTLIFSYDVCHASGKKQYRKGEICTEPSTVGFGFNNTRNPELVVGDFHFQVPRQEQVDDNILEIRARLVLNGYIASRGKVPDQIVILRDGVSEGQYEMVLNMELPAIRRGFQTALQNSKKTSKPKIAVVIATKRHSNRLYVRDQSGVLQNVAPLTALDSTITRKNGNEVIFVAHCPITPGTAQPVLLNVLINEGVFRSNDELVQFVAALCCTHQASSCVVSIPETIYAADEYAKRGAEMFQTYKALLASRKKRLPEIDGIGLDFQSITKTLCYDMSPVFRTRRIA